MNLLAETLGILKGCQKTPDDVLWVGVGVDDGSDPQPCGTWDSFAEYAKDIEYHNGYGTDEINSSLVIVGDDWWLERGEYDGAEWWEFKTLPEKPSRIVPLEYVHCKNDF